MGAAEKIDKFSIVPANWVRPPLLLPLFGITAEAAKKNRLRGVWLENKHWRKDPQGNIVYNWRAIDAWNAGTQ